MRVTKRYWKLLGAILVGVAAVAAVALILEVDHRTVIFLSVCVSLPSLCFWFCLTEMKRGWVIEDLRNQYSRLNNDDPERDM